MSKLAVVFAGQGSQYVGMGLDYIESHVQLKDHMNRASSILGYDVERILNSPHGEINDTLYTQPLTLLTSIFAYETLVETGVKIDAMLGFSLGEYSALHASGIFTFDDIIHIIKKRSELMKDAAQKYPGKMAAILGLSKDDVDHICKQASSTGIIVSANYNSPIQVVISGEEKAVECAIEIAKTQGAKRAMLLNVSGAFHSPLMKDAGTKLYQFLQAYKPSKPQIPVYLNTTAKPLVFDRLYQEMENQIQSSVYFEQSIQQMIEDGITHFIEVGPGTVLSGLIKKIDQNAFVSHIDKQSDLEALKGWLKAYGFIT